MPIPNAVSTRLASALAGVDAQTDLDLLISLIDVGQRSGSDIAIASAELLRRANLVDSNTSSIVASKIAAGLFKIDYPVTDLWTGAGGAAGSTEVGQLVSGFFTGNPKYVPANGSRYLLSAYPDMTSLVTNGAVASVHEPVMVDPLVLSGKMDTGTYKEQYLYTDGDVIIAPQQSSTSTTNGYLLAISTDAGITWNGCLPKAMLNAATGMPEIGSNGLGGGHIISVCKLGTAGSYGALIAATSTSGNLYYIYTTDFGVTWEGYALLQSSVNINSSRHSLYYRNGALLWVGPAVAKYSIDGGAVWTTLSDSNFTIGSFATTHHLSDDGYLVFTNNTTSIIYLQWPATTAGWSAAIAFTTAASKLAAGRTHIKKCGTYWVAFANSSGVVYYATTLLGTYATRSLTGVNGVRDVDFVNGNFFLIANSATTGWNVYSTPTMESASAPAIITQTAFPAFGNGTVALRWPMVSTVFQINMSPSNYVYYKHGREGIARTTSPDSSGTSQVYGTTPTLFPQFCRKYGMWFCTTGMAEQFPAALSPALLDLSMSGLHYRSTDGKNWIGIGTGRGGIVDAGSRLLRMNGSGLLEQSTNGITWDTTGIVRPTTGSIAVARLWCCKNVVYYYTSSSAANSTSANFYASTNGGASWTAVSGLSATGMVAMTKGSMCHYNGKYYCIMATVNGNPTTVDRVSADLLQILESTNGIAFSLVYSTNGSTGLFQYHQAGWIFNGAVLYCMGGFVNGTTQTLAFVTGDGRTYASAAGSPIVNALQVSSSVWDFDTANGDQRSMRERTFSVGSSTIKALDIYKEAALEATIVYASGASNHAISSVGGSEGHLMGVVQWSTYRYSPESVAFISPIPNSGASPMPFPFMRVAV